MIRKRLFISGRVQGVYFRAHTREKAIGLGLKGWVRNLPDGRVEALIEGSEEAVKTMIEWCKTGEPPSRVEQVEVIDETGPEEYCDFTILPTPR